MPRRPRNELPPDGIYHVTVRGVDRCLIVRDEPDWAALHALILAAQSQKFGSPYDAYCVMSSHFHLLVRAPLARLSDGMHWLNGTYAQRFNRRWGRVGHLFQSRFEAWVMRDEPHWRNTCSYILENPVKAGVCQYVEDWPWSGGRLSGR